MIYDAAIIGTGPAGLSAAITLKLHNKSILWLGAKNLSTKVEKSEKIANYPGVGLVTGKELIEKFTAHAEAMELEITEQMVTAIMSGGDYYMLSAGSDVYMAKTILLTTGAAAAKGFDGEEEFLGRGLSYCATCDGFLYRGKTIAVFCGDERFEHEIDYLAELAGKVYVFAPYAGGKYGKSANSIAPATLLKDLELDGAHIIVNREMETSMPGVFAAGDCTGRPYQIAKAVGEGNIAAHSIVEFLAEK